MTRQAGNVVVAAVMASLRESIQGYVLAAVPALRRLAGDDSQIATRASAHLGCGARQQRRRGRRRRHETHRRFLPRDRSRVVVVTDQTALGRGGLQVGRYGFGGAPIAGLFESVSEEQARECMGQAWSAGQRYFDTAPHYGAGLSEHRVGAFLAQKPSNEWVLSTKVGGSSRPPSSAASESAGFVDEPSARRVFDFSRDGIRRSFDSSLARLGVDKVDILFLHDPDDHWEQAIDEAWPALAALRDDGVVRSIGAGMNQTAMLTRFVQETDMDVVLLAGRYTLLRAGRTRRPATRVPRARYVGGDRWGLQQWPTRKPALATRRSTMRRRLPTCWRRHSRLMSVCSRYGVAIAAAALQFPLAHPGDHDSSYRSP